MTRISKTFAFQSYESLLFLCMLDSYVICVSALHLEIVFSHKIVGVAAFAAIYNFATRMSICRLPAFSVYSLLEREKSWLPTCGRSGGKGTRTPDIQLAKLALYQLSYAPIIIG